MAKLFLVEGTFGGDWAKPGSDLRTEVLEPAGFEVVRFEGWSTDVDGVPNPLEPAPMSDWIAGGHALSYLLRDYPPEDRNIIAHSHGGNVALYCAVAGCPISRLLTVCTPVRQDMRQAARVAKALIGRWEHVSSQGFDLWQSAGELFDGHFGWQQRTWPEADENVRIPGIGHSKLLNQPALFPLWHDDGLIDFLRGAGVRTVDQPVAGA